MQADDIIQVITHEYTKLLTEPYSEVCIISPV